MNKKKAVFNTFHSSVSNYFQRNEPEEVLAFDNRLEISLVESRYYKLVENLPIELAQAFLSPNVHLPMAKLTKTNLVIPKKCLEAKTEFLAKTFGLPFDEEKIEKIQESLNECLGTKYGFFTPTRVKNKSKFSKEKIKVIDIGIGYLNEYKNSALFEAKCSNHGNKEEIFNLINNLEPTNIFISNFKSINEINDLLDDLKQIGYKIEKDKIFDEETAIKAKKLYQEFYEHHLNKIDKEKEYDPKERTHDLKNWLIENSPSKHFIKK